MPKQAKTPQTPKGGRTEEDFKHPEYSCFHDKWRRAREVIAGEDEVKGAGARYLPHLEGMSPDEYLAYKTRAKYVNGTGRTLVGLHGMIFRKEPIVTVSKEMEPVKEDATLFGQSLVDYTKFVVKEVISVARGGTLVDWEEEEKRPYISFYMAENIWHWQTGRRNGRTVLTLLILREERKQETSGSTIAASKPGDIPELHGKTIEKLRVCVLTEEGLEMRILERDNDQKSFKLVDTIVPVRNGQRLDFIPFVFHTPEDSLPACCKLPLEDIISVNLHHYRLSADHDHGLHFTALPTAWVAGFKEGTVIRLGSATAWVTDNVEAKAEFLEFKGAGLSSIREALEDDKADMAVLGARLLEAQKKAAEAEGTVALRQAGEASVLASIAHATSIGMTMAMQIAAWWMGTEKSPSDIKPEIASLKLNSDFIETRLSPEELQALTASWIAGAISQDTMLENFRRGEILPANRTNEDEVALIEAAPPPTQIKATPAKGKPAK